MKDAGGNPSRYFTERNPDWHNGYWCDAAHTTSAAPTDEWETLQNLELMARKAKAKKIGNLWWLENGGKWYDSGR